MRPITHAAHRKFVETEGWTRKGTARSRKATGDHYRYTLALENGDNLYTKVSHGSGQVDDPKLCAHILRAELWVSEEDFWACVEHGIKPPRPQAETATPEEEKLDYKLVVNLIQRVGLSQQEVAKLSKDGAVRIWQEFLAGGQTGQGD